jgi:Protein of unknown function (DUF2802)
MEIGIDVAAAVRVILLGSAFAGFAWALTRMRREHAAQLDRVQATQRELVLQVNTLAERMSALATLVATLPKHVERAPEAPRAPPRREAAPMRSYETARRMATAGASLEEIVATSGLAASEARLLRRLHSGEPEHGNAA